MTERNGFKTVPYIHLRRFATPPPAEDNNDWIPICVGMTERARDRKYWIPDQVGNDREGRKTEIATTPERRFAMTKGM